MLPPNEALAANDEPQGNKATYEAFDAKNGPGGDPTGKYRHFEYDVPRRRLSLIKHCLLSFYSVDTRRMCSALRETLRPLAVGERGSDDAEPAVGFKIHQLGVPALVTSTFSEIRA